MSNIVATEERVVLLSNVDAWGVNVAHRIEGSDHYMYSLVLLCGHTLSFCQLSSRLRFGFCQAKP
jgi:hypothetical protein